MVGWGMSIKKGTRRLYERQSPTRRRQIREPIRITVTSNGTIVYGVIKRMAYDEVRGQHSWVVTHHLGWAENGEHVTVGGQHLS